MSNNDLITIDDSLITSPVLDYGIYLTSSLGNDETTNININNLIVTNIKSSSIKWFSDDSNGNININMNVSNSLFTTTALTSNIGSLTMNEISNITFNNNIFKDYSNQYAEDYFFNLETLGSSLTFLMNNNIFGNDNSINVDYYIKTNGPINAILTNQTLNNDSKFIYLIDISNHTFGNN